jgi:uncharacterized protein YegL
MPKYAADPSGSIQSTFGFTAVDISNLQDSEYTLVGIIADRSGSVGSFYRQEEKALKEIVSACARSPRVDKEYTVNGIIFVITDGDNNTGKHRNAAAVKKSIDQALRTECLESLVTILIGVNVTDSYVAGKLQTFAQEAGFTQYIELDKADEKTLARLAQFVSKSISSQSQSLGTGGPSQALTF